MMVLSKLTRGELKVELAEAVFNGDMFAAKVRLILLTELIDEEGFRSIEEINEFYAIKHFIDSHI